MSMLFHNPRFRVVNSSGVPYNAARLFVYTTGTTTPQNSYSDSTLLAANANPVVSDSGGLFGAIYLDQSLSKYKFVCKTSVADGDLTLWTIDPYENDNDGSFTGELTVTGDIRTGGIFEAYSATPKIYLSETDQGANLKNWEIVVDGGVLSVRTKTDADGAGKDIVVITRGATTALASIAIGNATDLPTITLNGTTLVATSIAQSSTGTFTGTLTGMSSATTGTISYIKTGRLVTLYVGSTISGTSNSTALTITGMPAAVYPHLSGLVVPCHYVLDNNIWISCMAHITTSVITLAPLDGTSVADFVTSDVSGFTNSGTKGLSAGWSITFPTAS